IELSVIVLGGDRFQRCKLVDACVVHQDVNSAEGAEGLADEPLCIGHLRNICLDSGSVAAAIVDVLHDSIRTFAAGSVVDDYGSPFSGKAPRNGGADAFGGARDERDFVAEGLTVVDE